MRCEAVSLALPLLVDSTGRLPVLATHIEGCLRCRGEIARYRRMRSALGELSKAVVDPPEWLSNQIVERCTGSPASGPLGTRRIARRVTTIAGLAGAAGAGVVIVAASRLRSKVGVAS